jgi:hypothetical protein
VVRSTSFTPFATANHVVVVARVADDLVGVDARVHAHDQRHKGVARRARERVPDARREVVLLAHFLPDLLGRDVVLVLEVVALEPVLQAVPGIDQRATDHES